VTLAAWFGSLQIIVFRFAEWCNLGGEVWWERGGCVGVLGSFKPRILMMVSAGVAVLVIAFVAAMMVYEVNLKRQEAMTEASNDSRSMSLLLQRYMEESFNQVDLVLMACVDEAERQLAAGRLDPAAINSLLARQVSRVPELLSLRIADADGIVRYGLGTALSGSMDIADRPYFSAHLARTDAGLFIDGPVFARISHKWALPLSRRINGPNGSFAGIVYANISIDYFQKMMSSIRVGEGGAVLLFDAKRNYIARWPELGGPATTTSMKLASSQVGDFIQRGNREEFNVIDATIDRVSRVYAFNKLPCCAVYVGAGIAEDSALRAVDGVTRVFLLVFTIFSVLMAAAVWWARLAWVRQGRLVAELSIGLSAKAELIRERFRFERTADTVPGMLFDHAVLPDGSDHFGYVSQGCRDLLGLDPADLVNDAGRFWGMVHPDDLEALREARFGAHLDEKSTQIELRIVPQSADEKRTGDEKWVYFVASSHASGPDDSGVISGVMMDITDRKRMEQDLERSNAELESFAAIASHDLRQPLRMIVSYLGLLDRRIGGDLDDNCRKFMGFAVDGARRMDKMIQGLLDYARVGRSGRQPQVVSLTATVAEALGNLESDIGEAGAVVSVAADLPEISGDSVELVRLFQNLVANAVKFRSSDRPSRISVEWQDAGRDVSVTVRDNGTGIDTDEQERVFGLFQRSSNQTEVEGTGIGLAVCRRIAERYGGQIRLDSVKGEGTRAVLTLPKVAAVVTS
jgi:PAS domain S-box-containing protein